MTRNTVYLEASARTRDLLTAQRALRAAKCFIGSTWHDQAAEGSEIAGVDWITGRYQELDRCDALIILCGEKHKTTLQVPLLLGYALARGLQVVWIGSSVRVASNNINMTQFETLADFCDTLAVRLAA
jgi:hypothetical protein